MTLKRLVQMGAAAGALIIASQANAADLFNAGGGYKDGPGMMAAPIWGGFYAGVNGGYGWRQTDDQFAYAACTGDGPGCPYPAYGGIGADGGFGGGQIGFNWQGVLGAYALVAGIEADIQGSGISGKGADVYGEGFKTDLDWFGTVRGRLGYAASNSLVYFTGGFAFGRLRQSAEDNGYTPAVYKSDDTVTGYVLGGGVEYKFNPSWSLKVEYQYLNFGKHDPAFSSGYPSAPASASADGFKVGDDAYHTVRVGLNYWVSPIYVPLK